MVTVSRSWPIVAEAGGVDRLIDLGRIALRYADSGAGSPTIVLIHEMAGSMASWDRLVPLLPTEWRVIRFDMRGHGLSEKPVGTLTMPMLVDDAMALLDALGVSGPIVPVGCAVGGAVALSIGARFPERCRAVVALAASTGIPVERRDAVLERADTLVRDGVRPTIDRGLNSGYPPVLRQDEAAFAVARASRIVADPEGFAAMFRMLAHLDMADELRGMTVPVFVVAGQHDQDRPPSLLEGVAATIPGARFATLNSGHFMAIHAPDLVAEAITGFLRDLPAPEVAPHDQK